jgi:hypothetical protein
MAAHTGGEERRAHLQVLEDLLGDVLAPLSAEDRSRFLERTIYADAQSSVATD